MKTVLRVLSRVVFLLSGVALPIAAQAQICNMSVATPRNEWQVLAGYSPASSTWIATAEGRKFLIAGVAYSRRCWQSASQTLIVSYTATFLPLAVVHQPQYRSLQFSEGTTKLIDHRPHAVYGISALPLGFTFDFGQKRVNPFSEAHGGIIASAERVPIDGIDSSGLNFMFDVGVGLRWQLGADHALRVGYRFAHISNAGTTPFNPGLDNNIVYVGFSFLR